MRLLKKDEKTTHWPHCIINMATTLVQVGRHPLLPASMLQLSNWSLCFYFCSHLPPLSPLNKAAGVMLWKHWSHPVTTLLHMSPWFSSTREMQHHYRYGSRDFHDLVLCSLCSLASSYMLPAQDHCTCSFLGLEDSSRYWHPPRLCLDVFFPVKPTLTLLELHPYPTFPGTSTLDFLP